MWLFDRLSNVLSGLGTEKDKTSYQRHVFAPRDRSELDAAYRGNAFVRKGIDIVPFDMLRAWRQWQASDDQVEAIEAAETALGLRTKLMAAMVRGRLYGGGAILIGDGASDPSQELVIDRLPKGGLKYLHALSRFEITAGAIELDPTSPWFGEPKDYQLNGARGGYQKIHPSRVVRFLGAPLPDGALSGHDPWSDSTLDAVFDAVDQATSSLQHIAALLPEAKTDIISIPGLSNLVSTEQGEKLLRDRLRVAMQMRSMFNVTLIDGGRAGDSGGGDTWNQKEIDFGTLPDVARLFLQVVSGAFDIPVTRMLGQSPAGMNATGDSDARNYYDFNYKRH